MRHLRYVLCFLLLYSPAVVQAQPRPGAFTTVQTTDTTANSLLVGCAVGSTSCTGGIKAGPGSFTTLASSSTATLNSAVVTTTLGVSGIGTFSVSGTALKVGSAGSPQASIAKAEIYHNAAYAALGLTNTAGATDEKYWQILQGNNTLIVRMVNDAANVTFDPFTITRSATTAATLTLNGALTASQTITPTSFSTDQNNYAPTGFATTFAIEVNNTDTVVHNITGIAGGTAGMLKLLCVSAGTNKGIQLPAESASSTAGNRFMGSGGTTVTLDKGQCSWIWYSPGSSRWLVTPGL